MIKKILAVLVIIVITAMVTHVWTMQNLCIETDGDGDSAIIKTVTGYWFYGINGYEAEEGYIGQSTGAIM